MEIHIRRCLGTVCVVVIDGVRVEVGTKVMLLVGVEL